MRDISVSLDRSSFSDKVYSAILELLINHRIKPGEKLNEKSIAELLHVSRTPVREALRRLASDGLVDFFPRRGVFAKAITSQDIRELYEIRRCLEVHAARQAIGNIPEERIEEIDGLIERCHRKDGAEFIEAELELDREIHRTISMFCRNSRLRHLLETLDHLAKFMRVIHSGREDVVRENFREHENIWRAMTAGEEERMVKLLEEHLDNRQECLLEVIRAMDASEETPLR